MAIRKHPTKGTGWWQVIISHGRKGKQEVHTFFCTEIEARAIEAELRGLPVEAKDAKITDVLGRFFDWFSIHRAAKTNVEYQRYLSRFVKLIGDRHLSLLNQYDYDRYKAARIAAGISKASINVELKAMRALLKWAKDNGHQVGEMPKRFEARYTQPKQIQVLTIDEINRLINQFDGHKKTIVQLMAWCGLRRNEALHLKRKNVDLSHNLLIITGKGGKTRMLPIIGAPLQQALKQACEDKTPEQYLFTRKNGKPYGDIGRALSEAAKAAGIEKHVHNHLLRHSFGTASILAGVHIRGLQTMLGHADISMTERYTHMGAELLRSEAAKLGDIFKGSEMSESGDDETP